MPKFVRACPPHDDGEERKIRRLAGAARAARDAGITVGRSQVRRILLAEKVRWRRTAPGRPAPTRSPH